MLRLSPSANLVRELLAAGFFIVGAAILIVAFAIGAESIEAKISFAVPIGGILLGISLAFLGVLASSATSGSSFLKAALQILLVVMSLPLLYVLFTLVFLGVSDRGAGSARELIRVGSMAGVNLGALIAARVFFRKRAGGPRKLK